MEVDRAVKAGLMDHNPFADFTPGDMGSKNYDRVDLHKNIVDSLILVSQHGQPMHRENDLIDVWFDSGSMPYAQWHYPFEHKEKIDDGLDFPRLYRRGCRSNSWVVLYSPRHWRTGV